MDQIIKLDTRKREGAICKPRISPLRRGERNNLTLTVAVRRDRRPYDLAGMTAHLVWQAADGKLVGPVPMEVADTASGTVRCTLPDACYSAVGMARAYIELRMGAELVDTTDEMLINVLDCIDADAEQAEEYKPLIAEAREATDAAIKAAAKAVSDTQSAIADVKATEAKLYPVAENILVGSDSGAVAHVEDAFAGASLREITVEGACKQDGIPSPDAPKPIAVIENPAVKVVGRNLLEFAFPARDASYSLGVACIPEYALEKISLPYTTQESSMGFGFVQELMPGSYTVKASNAPQKATVNVAGYASYKDIATPKKKIWYKIGQKLDAAATFSVDGEQPQWVVFCFAAEWGDGANKITYPADFKAVVEYGGTATEYKPYTSQTLTFTLPAEHPYLAKLPDGTADEIVVDEEGNVELVARVSKETIVASKIVDTWGKGYAIYSWPKDGRYSPNASSDGIAVICDKLKAETGSNIYRGLGIGISVGSTIANNKSCITTIALGDGADLSSIDGASFYYPLMTETRYPLGKIEMPKAQDSIVNAWTDAEVTPNTGIRYVRDVNIVVANLEKAIASITEG